MASPPTTIVPLPVVVAKHRIFLAAERFTAEVIIDPRVASAVIGEVPCPVEVSVAIDVNVPRAVRSEVSLAINRCVVSCANLGISRPIISRNISIAIDGNVMSRAKVLLSRQVSFLELFIPCDVSLANRVHPGFLIDRYM
jgi:hypothetical protein